MRGVKKDFLESEFFEYILEHSVKYHKWDKEHHRGDNEIVLAPSLLGVWWEGYPTTDKVAKKCLIVILIVRPQTPTDPAPLVLALCAGHVLTAKILFYEDPTVGTAGRSIHDSPALVEFLLCLFTGLSIMPRGHTAEAHFLIASRAFHLFVLFSSLHYSLTLRPGTELFLPIHGNLVILAELFELLEGLIIHKTFQEFVRDYFPTSRLWALYLVAFSRLSYLKSEEIL